MNHLWAQQYARDRQAGLMGQARSDLLLRDSGAGAHSPARVSRLWATLGRLFARTGRELANDRALEGVAKPIAGS